MKEMLIYFLFGKEGLQATGQGYQITKYSKLYFTNYASDSLDLINANRELPLTGDDFDFSQERMFRQEIFDSSQTEEFLRKTPTFWNVYVTGKYDLPSISLENIIILCSPYTTSSGFNLLTDLYENGGKVLGTASAQPGNNYGDLLYYELNASGIKGYVSFKQNITFPDDPMKGKCLMPDYPLTHEIFESFGFDPDTEILFAIELLEGK
jgi:hypothetical protein